MPRVSLICFLETIRSRCPIIGSLQRAFNDFYNECQIDSMKISISKTELMVVSKKPFQCFIQVGVETLKQVKKFKFLGYTFTIDGRVDGE